MKKSAAKKTTTSAKRGQSKKKSQPGNLDTFTIGLFDIGWRLASVVLIFLVGGSWLDNKYGTYPVLTLLGFVLIIFSFVGIVRATLKQIPRSKGGLKDD